MKLLAGFIEGVEVVELRAERSARGERHGLHVFRQLDPGGGEILEHHQRIRGEAVASLRGLVPEEHLVHADVVEELRVFLGAAPDEGGVLVVTRGGEPRGAHGAHESVGEGSGNRGELGVRLERPSHVAQARFDLVAVHAVEGRPGLGVGPRRDLRHGCLVDAAVTARAHLEDERGEGIAHRTAEHLALVLLLALDGGHDRGGHRRVHHHFLDALVLGLEREPRGIVHILLVEVVIVTAGSGERDVRDAA